MIYGQSVKICGRDKTISYDIYASKMIFGRNSFYLNKHTNYMFIWSIVWSYAELQYLMNYVFSMGTKEDINIMTITRPINFLPCNGF